jgi:hypothetical protein
MRTLLAACLLIAAPLAHAGVRVEMTDGTTLTVESHWIDGQQVHLVRGGVDMIVAKSRIKAIDEDVPDPEVYRDHGTAAAEATDVGDGQAGEPGAPAGEPAPPQAAAGDPKLSDLSEADLEALHGQEATRLTELQDERFHAAYGGGASPQAQQQIDDAVARQSHREAEVRAALQRAKTAEAGVPTVPAVEQPQ